MFFSLKLRGSVTIEVLDQDRNVNRVYKKNNVVTDYALEQLITYSTSFLNSIFASAKISISRSDVAPTYSSFNLNFIGTGYVPPGVVSPSFVDTIEPVTGEIINDIDYIEAQRTGIKTVALTYLGSQPSQNLNSNALAYTRLDNAITQGATEVLRIYYQVQFPYTGYGIKQWIQRELAKNIFGQIPSGINSFRYSYSTGIAPSSIDWDGMVAKRRGLVLSMHGYPWANDGPFVDQVISSHFKRKYTVTYTRLDTSILGSIINALFFGKSAESERLYSHNGVRYTKYTKEPYQAGFWHNTGATTPFFSTSESGVSQGVITFAGTWTKKIPQFYEILIGTGGATGTATYRFRRKWHTGVWGNNFLSRFFDIPWRSSIKPRNDIHGWQDGNVNIYKWTGETKIVQHDSIGITILDLWDGTYTTFNKARIPSFDPLEIGQIGVDVVNQIIYVGCRQTGIWIINVQTDSISHPITNPCFGIEVGRTGAIIDGQPEVWAIIDGRLTTRSTSWITASTISFTGLTDSNWSKCRFLKCDRFNTNDRLAIALDIGGGNTRIVWWDKTNSTATQGASSPDLLAPISLGWCEADPSFWACAINGILHKLNFGSSSSTSLSLNALGFSGQTPSPFTQIAQIQFYKDGVIGTNEIRNNSGVTIATIPNDQANPPDGDAPVTIIDLNATRHFCHLGEGICLVKKTNDASYLQQIISGYSQGWTSYGWNGSAWVEGNTNAKTTHSDAQSLFDGITIAFTNGSVPFISFIASEKFHRSVNWGLLKNNANQFSYTWGWYSKGLVKQIDYSATIPASSPYTRTLPVQSNIDFLRIETDSKEVNDFKINGAAIASLNVNGETPGPNEITLDGVTGVMTFHSSDAGKTVTGTYYWLAN